MHFDVLVKRVALRKGSEANFTFEGLGAGVGPVVVLQVLLGGEALPARLTHEGPFPCKERRMKPARSTNTARRASRERPPPLRRQT